MSPLQNNFFVEILFTRFSCDLVAFTPLSFPVTITDVKQLDHVLLRAPFLFIQQDVSSIVPWDLIDYKVYFKHPFDYPTTC